MRSVLALLAAAIIGLSIAQPAAANAAVPSAVGNVTFVGASPSAGTFLIIKAYDVDGALVRTEQPTPAAGAFQFSPLPAGSYYFSIAGFGTPKWGTQYLGNVSTLSQSEPVAIADGVTTDLGSITLTPAAQLSGRLIADSGTIDYSDNANIDLSVLNVETAEYEHYQHVTASDGFFTFSFLPPGTYIVRGASTNPYLRAAWYLSAVRASDATPIPLAAGETKNIQFDASTVGFSVRRIEGIDRFATNVAISQALFPPDQGPYELPVLYIANGLNFPDALSAGPAASHLGGGLLLVRPDAIPADTVTEIERLDPQRIVVVGSSASVSDEVLGQLAAIADTDRISGSSRYETSRAIVEDAFGCTESSCVDSVFIAAGSNFPDALAASPAAGFLDIPVVLVPGSAADLDPGVEQLLTQLGVSRAFIAGSETVVSAGVGADLEALLPGHVTRYAGQDRFDTATLINDGTFPSAEIAYLANGFQFADALAGGPLAAATGSPIYLTQQECLPRTSMRGIYRLDILKIVRLGGLSSVGEVSIGPECY